jgi:4-amino-4-deoxy-L-arabinose transferase-like glycosyltransferase
MSSHARLNSTLTLVFLAVATGLVYASILDDSPVHLHHDEVSVALQARSIAASGRDTDGRPLPLYFHIRDNVWFQPVFIYVTALFLTLSGISESAIRLPTVAVGVLNVVLMFVLAKRLFKTDRLAFVASGLLAVTPAHFIHSRLAMDALYPVPFVTAWLLGILVFQDQRRPWSMFAGTAFLGLGFYSHATSVLIMPACMLITFLALHLEGVASRRLYAVAATGFVLPLLLLAPWFLQHPQTYLDTVGRWGVHPAYLRNPLEGLRALANRNSLTSRVWIFWDFFNPSYLFFVGSPNLVGSTRQTGVFLLPLAVFLPIGLYQTLRFPRSRTIGLILLLGFASVPLVASTFNERQAIGNELAILPFAILIATHGVAQLLSRPPRLLRMAGICLLVLIPIQFGYFCHDYFTRYRATSSASFDGNVGGAAEAIIALEPRQEARRVFLSTDIPWIESFWTFYVAKHRREDLLVLTAYVGPQGLDWRDVPSGSFVLSRAGDTHIDALVKAGELRRVTLIAEPDGSPSFAISQR